MRKWLFYSMGMMLVFSLNACDGTKTADTDVPGHVVETVELNPVSDGPDAASVSVTGREIPNAFDRSKSLEKMATISPAHATVTTQVIDQRVITAAKNAKINTIPNFIGSKWAVADMHADVLSEDRLFLKGDILAQDFSDGLEVPYTFSNGHLEVTIGDRVMTGTWDGETLIVNGKEAIRQ